MPVSAVQHTFSNTFPSTHSPGCRGTPVSAVHIRTFPHTNFPIFTHKFPNIPRHISQHTFPRVQGHASECCTHIHTFPHTFPHTNFPIFLNTISSTHFPGCRGTPVGATQQEQPAHARAGLPRNKSRSEHRRIIACNTGATPVLHPCMSCGWRVCRASCMAVGIGVVASRRIAGMKQHAA